MNVTRSRRKMLLLAAAKEFESPCFCVIIVYNYGHCSLLYDFLGATANNGDKLTREGQRKRARNTGQRDWEI
jgi:hypothetical protein